MMTRWIGGWSVAIVLAAVLGLGLTFSWWDRAATRHEMRGRAAEVARARVVIGRLEREADALEALLRRADTLRAARPSVRVRIGRDVAPATAPNVARETAIDTTPRGVVEVDGVPWPVPIAVARTVERLVAELALADSVAAQAGRVVAIVDTVVVEVPRALEPGPRRPWWRRAVGVLVVPACAGAGAGVGALLGGPTGAVAAAVAGGATCTALPAR